MENYHLNDARWLSATIGEAYTRMVDTINQATAGNLINKATGHSAVASLNKVFNTLMSEMQTQLITSKTLQL